MEYALRGHDDRPEMVEAVYTLHLPARAAELTQSTDGPTIWEMQLFVPAKCSGSIVGKNGSLLLSIPQKGNGLRLRTLC